MWGLWVLPTPSHLFKEHAGIFALGCTQGPGARKGLQGGELGLGGAQS